MKTSQPGNAVRTLSSHAPIPASPVLISWHGDDATKVFVELCEMVEEAIETLEETGKPVPQPLRSAGG